MSKRRRIDISQTLNVWTTQPGVPASGEYDRQSPGDCALVICCLTATFLSTWLFRRPSFEISEAGVVSNQILLRSKIIPWDDIGSFEVSIKSWQPATMLKCPTRRDPPVVSIRLADAQENTLLEIRTESYDALDSKFVRAPIENLSFALTGGPPPEAMMAELE